MGYNKVCGSVKNKKVEKLFYEILNYVEKYGKCPEFNK